MTDGDLVERFRWIGLCLWLLFAFTTVGVAWFGHHALEDVLRWTTLTWLAAQGLLLLVRGVLRSRAAGWR